MPALLSKGVKFQERRSLGRNANGSPMEIIGSVTVPIYVGRKSIVCECAVGSSLDYPVLLAMDAVKLFRMDVSFDNTYDNTYKIVIKDSTGSEEVPVILACSVQISPEVENEVDPLKISEFNDFVKEWMNKFEKEASGITDVVSHTIYVDPNHPPVKQRFYRCSPAVLKEIHQQVDDLLSQGLIEESDSAWSSPVLLKEKKNKTWRLCVDFRKVNSITKKYAYPLPLITEILDSLKDAYYVSALDLKQGFHQILLDDESKKLTAFSIPGRGLFQYRVLPFGLSNAPSSFQYLIDKVLRPVLNINAFCYMDDILVVGRTFEEHQKALNQVFQLLLNANLKLNWKKCVFLKRKIEYLGFSVGSGEIRVSESKVEPIRNYPVPKTKEEVRSFHGVCNWYKRLIPNFSTVASPLTYLMRKNVAFAWNDEQQASFDHLKEVLCSDPVVCCPDFTKEFEIHTDASNVGLANVLVQRDDEGQERVVSYGSRSLNPAERKYDTMQRECLGVVFAVEYYRPYVQGSHFKVVTDHASLKFLHSIKNPQGRLARWILKLSPYDMEIVHRKGKLMVVPDTLSRVPYLTENTVKVNDVPEPGFAAVDLPPVPDLNTTKDDWYLELRNKVKYDPASYPKFQIADDLLYKKIDGDNLKLVVPSDFRSLLLEQYHDAKFAGHLGAAKTFDRLKLKYYWPKMAMFVKNYVKKCDICQKYKPMNALPYGGMRTERNLEVMSPGTAWSVDIVGPFPPTRKRNRFAVVFVDLCSKWLVVKPLRSATSKSIGKVLMEDIVLQYGKPQMLLSDNGSQFVSNLFVSLCKALHIKQYHTPLYFPAGNPVERYNRTIKTTIAMYCKENQRDWDEDLPYVVFSRRVAKNDTTTLSPSMLTYGREMNNPFDLIADVQPAAFDVDEYAQELFARLASAKEKAKEAQRKATERQAHGYNLRHRAHQFKCGDAVLRKNFPKSSAAKAETAKFFPRFVGPYLIEKIISPTQCQLVDSKNKPAGTWNVCHLKAYNG